MAKRKNPKKTKIPFIGKFLEGREFLIRPILICLLLGVLATGVFFIVQGVFFESRFFDVREIMVIADNRDLLPKMIEAKLKGPYTGRNIFTIDLVQVQRLLKNQFPELETIEVRRKLPDVLEVCVISRDPVAVIGVSGGVVIDRDGIILSVGSMPEKLVMIKGLRLSVKKSSIGEKIRNNGLERTLALLNAIRKKMGTKALNVESIDASDINNILLSINGVEIKMGFENFSKKIDQLLEVLNDPKMNLKDIKYIDLRFDDIVIAPR